MAKELLPEGLYHSVKQYKRRFYLNLLIKGLLFFIAIGLGYFFLISLLEYFGWFNSAVRAVFLFSFIGLVTATSYLLLFKPLYSMLNAEKLISDEKAAAELGVIFPDVKDKLLNLLQLRALSEGNSLAFASIQQKSAELSDIPFDQAIDLRENRKHLKFLVPVLLVALAGAILIPGLFTDSPKRIAGFNKIFPKPAPFNFKIQNSNLNAFRNEDFKVKFTIQGSEIPEIIKVYSNGSANVIQQENDSTFFSYTFHNLQQEQTFQFEGAGFYSEEFKINVIDKPLIGSINAKLVFPSYLNRKSETEKNTGNLTVPEGTKITWDISCLYTEKINFKLSDKPEPNVLEAGIFNGFSISKTADKTFNYNIKLLNDKASGDGELQYTVNVIADAFPRISVLPVKDSSLFNYILLGGNVEDDYGFSALKVFYKIRNNNEKTEKAYASFPLKINKSISLQNFFFHWEVDSLNLQPGDKLEYFVKVWDNDGVNGAKSATSQTYSLELPTTKNVQDELKNKQAETAQSLGSSFSQSKSLSKQLDKIQDNLKSKKELNWQDKKSLEDLLQKQNELKQKIENLQQQNKLNNEKEEKFSPQDEELAEKTKELQELMKDILDDETMKLYEELQKLLQEKSETSEIKDVLEKLENKQERFDKELERALEMFKQLKFEKELDKSIKDLAQLVKEQEKQAEKSSDNKAKPEDLQKQQEALNEKFDDVKKDLKELEELNKTLEEKNEFKPNDPLQKDISEKQENSAGELSKGNKKSAQKQQKGAAEQMDKLQKEMFAMKQKMDSESAEENVQDLRYLLENLLSVSFEQETLMKEFKKINQTDPRYIALLQREIKLKDDSKIIEDSLYALAKRVAPIKKFVTKEVGDMNDYVDESILALRQRRPDISAGKQQFAMTSMNNLALMLSDVLKQMQQQQQKMKGMPSGAQCKKPGKGKPGQSMSELQKALNQKIDGLKKSGKQGKELSQELAMLIAEQQAIRKMVKEAEGKGGMDPIGKQQLKELAKKMEETEKELSFKQLSQQTIMRQNDIVTRLLESEKAQREREFEEKRESKTGNIAEDRKYPPALEKYLKEKDKQIEMLKSTPPAFNPYYKEKVSQYFQKISQ